MSKPLLFSMLIGVTSGISVAHNVMGTLRIVMGDDGGERNLFVGVFCAVAAFLIWRIKEHVCRR